MNILYKIEKELSKDCAAYFKKTWIQHNGLSTRQFKNRMKNANEKDIALLCHVCSLDEKEILKPLKDEFKNIAPYGVKTFQTTL